MYFDRKHMTSVFWFCDNDWLTISISITYTFFHILAEKMQDAVLYLHINFILIFKCLTLMHIVHWIYLMHFVDAFIQSNMHCIQHSKFPSVKSTLLGFYCEGSFYQSISHVLGIASLLLIYRSYYTAFCSEEMLGSNPKDKFLL